jgi:nitrogen fixation protein NifB
MVRRREVHEAIEAELEAKHNRPNEALVTLTGMKKKETRPVLMAIATSGGGVINQHFGHATEFLIYEASSIDVRFVSHRKVDLYCSGGDTCGDAETTLDKIIRTLSGCEVVLCSKIGYEPWGMLEQAGIQPNGEHAMEPIEEAVAAVYLEMAQNGLLEEQQAADAQQLTA